MKILFKELLPICLLTILCTMVLSIAYEFVKERISQNIKIKKLQTITAVMTAGFDNNIYEDVRTIHYINDNGDNLSTNVYRARKSDTPVGVVFIPITATGYNGPIHLSVGILHDGTVSGVQVLTHSETPGLGDSIHQDNSDWLMSFTNQSLAITPAELWALKSSSGMFDQISGATITSRSVTNTIRSALELYTAERDKLFQN